LVRVRLGDVAPADIKLSEGEYLLVDQSALTGESSPVEKRTSDVAYAGSVIRQGEMDGVVVGTGINSYFGKTAKLVQEAKTRSHFQKAVIRIGNYLIILSAILASIVFLVAIFRHENFLETAQFALVLVVAAIPVALPAVLTVTMAVGAVALAKKEAIISKLVSIEEMAGMDVLCCDKTGTITMNELTLAEIETFGSFGTEDTLRARVLIFLTTAILAFNSYPISPMMIVILAMLNDLPIMMIAYDNAKIYERPVRWDMREVLVIATVLGSARVFSSFLLLWFGVEVSRLDSLTIQTLVFLKLAVAGHMTIYRARCIRLGILIPLLYIQ
jgi:P-type E1-E2 ATPase